MNLKYSIAREDDYKKEVIEYYNSILNGRLMSIDPSKASDSELTSYISVYDENESYFNNCCSWLEIGDIGSSNYNGRDFQYIKLLTKSGNTLQINFSQFRYEMSTSLGKEGFTSFDPEKAVHVCSIDGQIIDPPYFFSINKGKKLLYLYSFLAVTAFNKNKLCYKFAFENISASHLRKYIHNVQMNVLQKCIAYPAADTPYTSIKIEVEGAANSRPTYQHFVKSKFIDEFAISIFESEFKEKFQNKLKDIKSLAE
jgi:hypothetical protein